MKSENIWNRIAIVRECLLGRRCVTAAQSAPVACVACFACCIRPSSGPIAKSFAWWDPFKFYAHKINSPCCASAEKWHIVGGVIEEPEAWLFFCCVRGWIFRFFSASFTRSFIVLVKVKLIICLFAGCASVCVNEIQHTRSTEHSGYYKQPLSCQWSTRAELQHMYICHIYHYVNAHTHHGRQPTRSFVWEKERCQTPPFSILFEATPYRREFKIFKLEYVWLNLVGKVKVLRVKSIFGWIKAFLSYIIIWLQLSAINFGISNHF